MEHTLEVFFGDAVIFSSNKKWLHPLFDFEDFLKMNVYKPSELKVYDKIVGIASAVLLVRLGILHVRAGTLSKGGKTLFDTHNVEYTYELLVERIACRTEEMLVEENNVEKAYKILRKQATL